VLIETYDDNLSGAIVFSKNKFDLLTNFVIVNKADPELSKNLDYKEVSELISKPVKKNLILYRLLTNDPNLDPYSSKISYYLKLEKKIEIVYFDPIFLLKDLEHLKITLPKEKFRFKIQQVGYKTKRIVDDTVIYEEHFCNDLTEKEAEQKNDSIIAKNMLSQKIKNEGANNQELRNSPEEVFENIYSEISKKERKFYHIEKKETSKRVTDVSRETNFEEVKGDRDFFSRVNKKMKGKETYKSSTLKMFQ